MDNILKEALKTSEDGTEDISQGEEALEASQEISPVAALEEQVNSLKDQLLRSLAEGENLRKRTQREQEETAKYAVSGFSRDLLGVADNLRRALETGAPLKEDHSPSTGLDLGPLLEGIEMTERELLRVFEKYGIRKIFPLGEKFDHNFHQAITEVDSPDQDAGIVISVFQAGYAVHDRLLRPAMVAVAKNKVL